MEIDNSTLHTYTDCRIKAMLMYVMHRKPRSDGDAAWFGTEFHKFVEHYWQPGDKWKDIALNYEQRFEEFLNKKAKVGKVSNGESIDPEVFINCLRQFVQQVPRIVNEKNEIILLDATTMQPTYKIRHRPEIGFKFPIGSHTYMGKLDTLVEDFNNNLWIFDIKTTGEYNRNKQTNEAIPRFAWTEQFRMSTQFTGYIRALQHHTQRTIAGSIVLAVPRAKGKIRVTPIIVRRTNSELEQWEYQTKALISQFANDASWFDLYPDSPERALDHVIPTGKYNGACTRFGICPMFDICKSNYNPGIIDYSTVYKEWNPLQVEENDN